MSNISYREFIETSDYRGQRELFNLSFPETAGTAVATDDHYNWKFRQFPTQPSSYEYVGHDGNKLVGYYAALPYPYQVRGKDLTCGMVCDVMTHPGCRGQGIFTKIGFHSTSSLAGQGIAFTTGYPIRPEVIPGHIKVGWKIVQQMPMYLRPLGVGSFLPRSLRFLAAFFNPLITTIQRLFSSKNRAYTVEIYTADEFFLHFQQEHQKNSYSAFLDLWLKGQPVALVKSLEFLRWRTRAPKTKYHFLILKNNQAIVGLAVARPTILKGVSSLAVLDFCVLQEHIRGSCNLHCSLLELGLSLKLDVIVCMTSRAWAKTYGFFRSLFLPTPAVFSLIVKKLSQDLEESLVYSGNSWHTFWIDSDDL